jgi:hypothetical protein
MFINASSIENFDHRIVEGVHVTHKFGGHVFKVLKADHSSAVLTVECVHCEEDCWMKVGETEDNLIRRYSYLTPLEAEIMMGLKPTSKPEPPVKPNTIQFRWHRGTLDESMATAVQIEPTIAALMAVLNKDALVQTVVTELQIEFYAFDERIQQPLYMVSSKTQGVFGWLDHPLRDFATTPYVPVDETATMASSFQSMLRDLVNRQATK